MAKKLFSIRLDEDEMAMLIARANDECCPISEVLRKALRRGLAPQRTTAVLMPGPQTYTNGNCSFTLQQVMIDGA